MTRPDPDDLPSLSELAEDQAELDRWYRKQAAKACAEHYGQEWK